MRRASGQPGRDPWAGCPGKEGDRWLDPTLGDARVACMLAIGMNGAPDGDRRVDRSLRTSVAAVTGKLLRSSRHRRPDLPAGRRLRVEERDRSGMTRAFGRTPMGNDHPLRPREMAQGNRPVRPAHHAAKVSAAPQLPPR
jgi:hypothetical protein